MSSCSAIGLTALLALAPPATATSQQAETTPEVPRRLQLTSSGEVTVGDLDLEYTSAMKDYAIRDDQGEVTAHFTAFSYVLDTDERRPVTFAFNGGPGSSSVWLHMGILGPKRVVVPSDAGNAGAPPYPLVENPYTLLTHTDLVFVDPVGTGYSRAVGDSEDEDFWGVDEDVDSVARFIREWLSQNVRWGSRKYVLGESYGGVRGALLGQALKGNSMSVALNGLIFVSPAFDIQFVDGREDDLTYVTSLPTYAATALFHDALPIRVEDRDAWLREVRDFASGPYLRALFAGQGLDTEQRAGVVRDLSSYTGLSEGYWERANLRVSASRFRKELLRQRGVVVGRLDTRYQGSETDAVGESPDSDPMMNGIGSAYVAGFQQYLRQEFGSQLPERPYRFSGNGVFGKWKRSESDQAAFAGWLDTVPALADTMQKNPQLLVFCANGWFDVATTVLAAEYNLSRPGIDAERVVIRNYDAGHMMYVHKPSLERLARDLRQFYE